MASTTTAHISLADLPRTQAQALKKKAARQGMTLQQYIQQLISDDLQLDQQAASRNFTELSAPFQKALAGLSENDLDAMARPTRRKTKR